MKRIRVESTSINTIAYDYVTSILEVEFSRGVTYRYKNVPVHTVCQMLFKENSIGKYFQANIAKTYECEKLESE